MLKEVGSWMEFMLWLVPLALSFYVTAFFYRTPTKGDWAGTIAETRDGDWDFKHPAAVASLQQNPAALLAVIFEESLHVPLSRLRWWTQLKEVMAPLGWLEELLIKTLALLATGVHLAVQPFARWMPQVDLQSITETAADPQLQAVLPEAAARVNGTEPGVQHYSAEITETLSQEMLPPGEPQEDFSQRFGRYSREILTSV